MSIACFKIRKRRATFNRQSNLCWWMWLVQSVFERAVVVGRLTVWYRGNPTKIFTCELVWKISGLNLVWNFSYMIFFIHEIGVNFLSGMFNLVPHVKFLICIHFKHVSGVNQVWNRPDLMRIFCTGQRYLKYKGTYLTLCCNTSWPETPLYLDKIIATFSMISEEFLWTKHNLHDYF